MQSSLMILQLFCDLFHLYWMNTKFTSRIRLFVHIIACNQVKLLLTRKCWLYNCDAQVAELRSSKPPSHTAPHIWLHGGRKYTAWPGQEPAAMGRRLDRQLLKQGTNCISASVCMCQTYWLTLLYQIQDFLCFTRITSG